MKKISFQLKVGLLLMALILLGIIFAPWITPYDPLQGEASQRFMDPSTSHLLGTDYFGRDILSRILHGGRLTLPAAFLSLFLTTLIGLILGMVAAFYEGKLLDNIIMRLADLLIAIPFIVIAMAVSSFFGRGLDQLLILIILFWWAPFARLVRSLTLPLLKEPFVQASRLAGASNFRIAVRDILPMIGGQVSIQFTFQLSNSILTLSMLSFFGLGSQPPTPEWGAMLADGRQHFATNPGLLFWTSCAIFLVVLACNMIGEGLKETFSPIDIPKKWEVQSFG